MTSWVFLVLLGLFTSIYGTIIGLGGGFIIVPALLMVSPEYSPALITSISLAVIFINASSSSLAYARMKRINYRLGLIFAVAAIPSTMLGALSIKFVPRQLFELIFGIILIGFSLFLMMKPEKKPKGKQEGEEAQAVNLPLIIGSSVLTGFLSSLLGIGGGIVYVPFMIYMFHIPVHIATATSHFILLISSLSATITHIADGTLAGGVWHVVFLSLGVVVGAQIGAYLSNFLKASWIVRSLALAILFTGLKLIFSC